MLNRTSLMQFALRLKVGVVGFFGRLVRTKVFLSIVNHYRGDEGSSRSPQVNAEKADLVSRLRSSLILRVKTSLNGAKIRKSIVRFFPVDMVYLSNGPLTGHVEDRKSMRRIMLVVEADTPVSGPFACASCYRADCRSFPAFYIGEDAGLRVVMNKLAHALKCNIPDSHWTLPRLVVRAGSALQRTLGSSIFLSPKVACNG